MTRSPQALQDVAAGEVPFLFDQLTAGDALIKAGRLRPLAVTSPARSPLAPEVPTMAEAGCPASRWCHGRRFTPHAAPRPGSCGACTVPWPMRWRNRPCASA